MTSSETPKATAAPDDPGPAAIDASRDRSAEHALAESELRYRRLFESAMDGILILDAENGVVVDVNPFLMALMGFSREQILGKSIWDLGFLKDVWANELKFQELRATEYVRYDYLPLESADGRKIEVEFVSNVYLVDGHKVIQCNIRDQTAHRKALREAEAADHVRSAFIATMSHELRTPLNSIIGFTDIVLQGLSGPLTPEQRKQLGMVLTSARHLLELINDVLDLSRIEAGQVQTHIEAFDLRTSVERVTALIKPLADKKGLALASLVAPDIHEVVSDRRRVEQILINLLNNAVKFTDRGGVTLTVTNVADFQFSLGAPKRQALRFDVSDTGIGIKPENLATLFEPFQQIDSEIARDGEGTGLGLAICRRLAAALGGDVSAVSEYAQHSVFTFVLPLQGSSGHEPLIAN